MGIGQLWLLSENLSPKKIVELMQRYLSRVCVGYWTRIKTLCLFMNLCTKYIKVANHTMFTTRPYLRVPSSSMSLIDYSVFIKSLSFSSLLPQPSFGVPGFLHSCFIPPLPQPTFIEKEKCSHVPSFASYYVTNDLKLLIPLPPPPEFMNHCSQCLWH